MPYRSCIIAALASAVFLASAAAQDFPARTVLPNDLVNPALTTPLSGADASLVRETVVRIYLAEDARDYDAFFELMTDDFVQEHSIYGRIEGPQAFVDWLRANPESFDRYRHMALNTVTSATGENSAEALSYILVLDLHPAPESDPTALPRILAHGVVRDTLRREDGHWRISHRIYDQFAVTAAVVADESARLNAARALDRSDAE